MNTKIIAEIGINPFFGKNRSKFIENAKKLIDVAAFSGCDYVKFQKRHPNDCVPKEQQNKIKKVPWRKEPTTYLQYKLDIEFDERDYLELSQYCFDKKIQWFASAWDLKSVEFLKTYNDYGIIKIPSAKIHDYKLCEKARESCKTLIISTGMSTEQEIDECIQYCNPDVIMHCNATYPTPENEINLNYIKWLKEKYPNKQIGYSCHYFGLTPCMASVALGVEWIEKHITLNRTEFGSDQMSSVEPHGVIKLVKGIRTMEKALRGYGPRELSESEKIKKQELR